MNKLIIERVPGFSDKNMYEWCKLLDDTLETTMIVKKGSGKYVK